MQYTAEQCYGLSLEEEECLLDNQNVCKPSADTIVFANVICLYKRVGFLQLPISEKLPIFKFITSEIQVQDAVKENQIKMPAVRNIPEAQFARVTGKKHITAFLIIFSLLYCSQFSSYATVMYWYCIMI